MTNDTIWRDWIPANYFTKDYMEEGEDRQLTIKGVKREKVADPMNRKNTTDEMVVHFEEDVPPMIFNVTNSRTVQKLTGTPKVNEWSGARILVYYDPTIKVGGVAKGGLRIRPYPPEPEKEPETAICHDCGQTVPDYQGVSGAVIASKYQELYGDTLCYDCGQKRKVPQ